MVMADYQSAVHNLIRNPGTLEIAWRGGFVFLVREQDRELLAVYRISRIDARGSGAVLNIPNNWEETNRMSRKYTRAKAR
jgi:hypothetical protein